MTMRWSILPRLGLEAACFRRAEQSYAIEAIYGAIVARDIVTMQLVGMSIALVVALDRKGYFGLRTGGLW